MTEDEARTKTCQETLTVPAGPSKCIASDCMAWRTKRKPQPHDVGDQIGYCGKAGVPT